MLKTSLVLILRILLGLTFLFSGISKLFPIEPFEYSLVDQHLSTWNMAPFMSRGLISLELFIGVLFLLNGFKYRILYYLSAGILVLFSFYLVHQFYLHGNESNCGCFGDLLPMGAGTSLLKNVLLLVLLFLLWSFNKQTIKSGLPFWTLFPAILALSIPPVINPPDFYFNWSKQPTSTTASIDFEHLGQYVPEVEGFTAADKPVFLAFFSTTCPHCIQTAYKLSIIQQQHNEELKVLAILYGDTLKVQEFLTSSRMQLPFGFYNHRNFLKITEGRIPAIFAIKNRQIIKRWDKMELTESEMLNLVHQPLP